MSDHESAHEHATELDEGAASPPTQAQLYDDLRRIGQLEDQKQAIQNEIDQRTERLRAAVPNLDQHSLLYELLSKSMQPLKKTSKARSAKASTKKKSRRVTKKRS